MQLHSVSNQHTPCAQAASSHMLHSYCTCHLRTQLEEWCGCHLLFAVASLMPHCACFTDFRSYYTGRCDRRLMCIHLAQSSWPCQPDVVTLYQMVLHLLLQGWVSNGCTLGCHGLVASLSRGESLTKNANGSQAHSFLLLRLVHRFGIYNLLASFAHHTHNLRTQCSVACRYDELTFAKRGGMPIYVVWMVQRLKEPEVQAMLNNLQGSSWMLDKKPHQTHLTVPAHIIESVLTILRSS